MVLDAYPPKIEVNTATLPALHGYPKDREVMATKQDEEAKQDKGQNKTAGAKEDKRDKTRQSRKTNKNIKINEGTTIAFTLRLASHGRAVCVTVSS